MKSRTTQILLAIFVVMVGVVAWNNNRQPPPPLITPLPEVFPSVQATDITKIELFNILNHDHITMIKASGIWNITDADGKPSGIPARQISNILQFLPGLRYNRVMDGSDLRAYGLDMGGFYDVRFTAGTTHTLYIGDVTSDGTYVYVKRDSDPRVLQVSLNDVYNIVSPVYAAPIVATEAP
jgi:hypothetical protein